MIGWSSFAIPLPCYRSKNTLHSEIRRAERMYVAISDKRSRQTYNETMVTDITEAFNPGFDFRRG
jgi:hypothetical protein